MRVTLRRKVSQGCAPIGRWYCLGGPMCRQMAARGPHPQKLRLGDNTWRCVGRGEREAIEEACSKDEKVVQRAKNFAREDPGSVSFTRTKACYFRCGGWKVGHRTHTRCVCRTECSRWRFVPLSLPTLTLGHRLCPRLTVCLERVRFGWQG